MNKDTTPEAGQQAEPGIGELLRTEREKKGISKSRLAEIIKVRDHVIDAIETQMIYLCLNVSRYMIVPYVWLIIYFILYFFKPEYSFTKFC